MIQIRPHQPLVPTPTHGREAQLLRQLGRQVANVLRAVSDANVSAQASAVLAEVLSLAAQVETTARRKPIAQLTAAELSVEVEALRREIDQALGERVVKTAKAAMGETDVLLAIFNLPVPSFTARVIEARGQLTSIEAFAARSSPMAKAAVFGDELVLVVDGMVKRLPLDHPAPKLQQRLAAAERLLAKSAQ